MKFYFDYVSPYAYLASTQIRALAAKHGRELEYVPVLFAGLLASTGSKGPAEVPVKREYLFRDIVRLARMLDVPLNPPATHPFNPLLALRATHLGAPPDLVDTLFRATWVDSLRIDQPDVVAKIAGPDRVDRAAEAKDRLRKATDDAIAAGVFGVPSVIVDDELFWGVDSLPLLERYLSGRDPSEPERVKSFLDVVPSTTRKM